MSLLEYHHHGMEPDFYWQVMTCLFISRLRNVLDPPVRITTTSQNKCLYIYLLLFSYPKLNSQCFLWVSQPRVTSSPKPEALAYFFSGSACDISPGYFTHSPDHSESNSLRLFMGQSGQVRGSNNLSRAIFIITSYKAAYVCLSDAKYRHSLPHTPTGN